MQRSDDVSHRVGNLNEKNELEKLPTKHGCIHVEDGSLVVTSVFFVPNDAVDENWSKENAEK